MKNNATSELKRTLGLPSLFAVAIGVVVAQVCFVSVLQGVAIGGASFFIALLIAFFLTLCYVFTFSELALMLPRAGSLSSYTEVAMGHFPAIIATITGYLAPAIFGLPAELFLVEHILDLLYPGSLGNIGIIILIGITILNLLGIEIFSTVQNLLAFMMIVALLIVGVVGLSPNNADVVINPPLWESFKDLDFGVFSLVVLALWAFVGLEFTCPLIEETKNPEKNLPKSMIGAAIILLIVYSLIAFAGYNNVPVDDLTNSDIPHFLLVQNLFGDTGKLIMAVLAITATCSTINTAIATVSRMLFGMAHNHQVPKIFMRVHSQSQTPWFSILFVASLIMLPLIFLRGAQDFILLMIISAATLWLVAYIIAHLDLMILRKKYPEYKRPFKSPWYPIPQIAGILGMGYMVINNSPSPDMTFQVYTNASIFVLFVGAYAAIWVKFKMKKGLFETEPIEKALKD
jgi:amino acid transporter